jgi:hypothetical protein
MTPVPLRRPDEVESLMPGERAIARSVLYASLFDYPLTLAQLRQTLIESRQTPTDILNTYRRSAALRELISFEDGYFFPTGRADLLAERRRREVRSRAFLRAHRLLLQLIAAMPYVRMVSLSGSIAHLNLESGGDLDLFIVTQGGHVWSAAVGVVLLAKLLGRRRTLCANYIVSDAALSFESADLFTASQIINLKPLTGAGTYRRILELNPFVRRFYPNFHAPDCGTLPLAQPQLVTWTKRALEPLLLLPSALVERVCRAAYRGYLQRRAATWQSPQEVRLENDCLKLHTRSHRTQVMRRFDEAVRRAIE